MMKKFNLFFFNLCCLRIEDKGIPQNNILFMYFSSHHLIEVVNNSEPMLTENVIRREKNS